MTNQRKIKLTLLAGLLVLIAFLSFIKFKTDAATSVYIEETELIRLQEGAIFSLNDWEMRSWEAEAGNDFTYYSEQELMEQSQLNLQANQADQANQLFYGQKAAQIDAKDQVMVLNDATYPYQDNGESTDTLRRYTFEEENPPISSENLTVLVTQAIIQTEARNQPIWQATWLAAGLYIGCFTIGVLILFNLERVATGLLQLFIKGAEAGPMFKLLLGTSSLMLMVSACLVLYSVLNSIQW